MAGDPTIRATLGLDSSSFKRGLQDAEKSGRDFQRSWASALRGLGFGAAAMGVLRFVESVANKAREIETNLLASGRAVDANVAAASRLAGAFAEIRQDTANIAAQTLGFLARIGEGVGTGIANAIYGIDQVGAAERSAQAAEQAERRLAEARRLAQERARIEAAATAAREAEEKRIATLYERRAELMRRAELDRMSTVERIRQLEHEITTLARARAGESEEQREQRKLTLLQRQAELFREQQNRERELEEERRQAERAREQAMRNHLAMLNAEFAAQKRNLELQQQAAQIQQRAESQIADLAQQYKQVGRPDQRFNLQDYAAGAAGTLGQQQLARYLASELARADQMEARGTSRQDVVERIRDSVQRQLEKLPDVARTMQEERQRIRDEATSIAKDSLDQLKQIRTELTGANR
jgi:hypothetical protein